MTIADRQELARFLNERMAGTYAALAERQRLEVDTSLLKTYLLEAHAEDEPGARLELIERITAEGDFGRAQRPEVASTGEETLVVLESRFGRESTSLYLDFTNSRFWLLHSMASSGASDYLVERLVSAAPALDRVWLPADLLERASRLGSFRGLGLDYDRRVFLAEAESTDEDGDVPVEFLKMQLWGNRAGEILRTLRDNEAFAHETTLAKVRLRYSAFSGDPEFFTLDEIKFDGKTTARGTSFESHNDLLTTLLRIYRAHLERLEDVYALRLTEDAVTGSPFSGAPIYLEFVRPITNLPVFCERLLSSADPFRLWGVAQEMSAGYYRARAVDLHVGKPLSLEIHPHVIAVYLSRESCGNSFVRLYTNLQHHYDALTRAAGAEGEQLFAFQPDDAQHVDRSLPRGP